MREKNDAAGRADQPRKPQKDLKRNDRPLAREQRKPKGAAGVNSAFAKEKNSHTGPAKGFPARPQRPTPNARKPYFDADQKGIGGARPAQTGFADNKRPAASALPSANARRVALEIFSDVMHQDAYAALSLDSKMSKANLTQLDKRFCASIVYRTLENLIHIDYALSFFLKDAESLHPQVRDILRISVCQFLFHDRVPDNAVVDEAVKLTRELGLESMTGLTNAVLRAFLRDRDKIKWPGPEEGARYLSILYSVPEWLAEKLLAAYGDETAREICAYRSESHFTTIRPNLMRFTDEAFESLMQKKVWQVEKGAVAHAFRVRMASEIARDADYLAGNFSIEGESSILAAQAVDAKRGMQILDCCAAPGGKTAYLAETMQGTGRVYAWDVHDHRVALIRAMARRLGLENIRPVVRDATVQKEDLIGRMDAVLLDAPCSGLGVMDNKPDIKLRATEQSISELTQIQEKLLETCCAYVKQGGTLVYSTCSMLPEENKNQIQSFLLRHPEFEIAPLPDGIDERFRAEYGAFGLQLLPHRDHVEGFYIARMRKVK